MKKIGVKSPTLDFFRPRSRPIQVAGSTSIGASSSPKGWGVLQENHETLGKPYENPGNHRDHV